jgi:hypothetical protein
MFGMGMGRGNSSLRMLRLGLLVMVILAGVVFHHSGGVYDTIHAIYYVLIVGFIVFAIATRRRSRQSPGGTAGGSWGGTSGGSWGNTPPPAQPPPSSDPPGGTAGGSWGNSPAPTQPPPSSDPPAGTAGGSWGGTSGGSWGNTPPPAQPPPSSDPPIDLVNEHDRGQSEPRPNPPSN